MDQLSAQPTPPPGGPRSYLAGPVLFVLLVWLAHYLINVPKADMIERDDEPRSSSSSTKGKDREHKQFSEQNRDEGFARVHEPVMEFAYELAHSTVFPPEAERGTPAPASFLQSFECHRWRCQYQLCGPRKKLSQVVRVLEELEHEDDDLWDAFEKNTRRGVKKKESCQRITVRFSRPGPEPKGIRPSKKSLERLERAREAQDRAEERRKKRAAELAAKKAKAKGEAADPEADEPEDGGAMFVPVDPPQPVEKTKD